MIAFLGENPHLLRTILIVRVVITLVILYLTRGGKIMLFMKKTKKRRISTSPMKDALNVSASAIDQVDQLLSTIISVVDKCKVLGSLIGPKTTIKKGGNEYEQNR